MTRQTAITAALEALQVEHADGSKPSLANSIHLIVDEEGPEALVESVLDAADRVRAGET